MSAFYGLFQTSVRQRGTAARLGALALMVLLAAPAAGQDKIAFPSYAHGQTVAYNTPSGGGAEYLMVGTHSFGVYLENPAAIGRNRWFEGNGGLTIPLTIQDFEVMSTGKIVMGVAGRGGLYYSTDGGFNWTVYARTDFDSLAVNSVSAIEEDPDGHLLMAADDGNIFLSEDAALTWTFNGRLPGGSSQHPWTLLADPNNEGRFYAGTHGYGVFVTNDHGGLWSPVQDNRTDEVRDAMGAITTPGSGLVIKSGGHVFDLAFDPTTPTILYAATGLGLYRIDLASPSNVWELSTNATNTLTLVDGTVVSFTRDIVTYPDNNPNAARGPELRSLAFAADGTLYMAAWGWGVLKNTAPAGTAGHSQIMLKDEQVAAVAVSPSGLLGVAAESGIVTMQLSTATGVEPTEVPAAFALSQNYPNPFNPETSIRFDLPAASDIHMAVYDVLGREVARLASGVYPAGSHELTMNASGLTSGLYLYKLTAGGQTITRSMSLLK